MTRRKAPHEKLKPGRKPRVSLVPEQQPEVLAAATVQPASTLVAPEAVAQHAEPARPRDALQRHRNIDLMDEAELREYALQVGVNRRDAATLAVPRLKQNCMLVLTQLIEDLS